ncbi:MAG: heme d1 biosynthesis radical SAM protein NirJ [Gammaproteobacteria bacterium]|nr:heme d1 biosynthesis radical SAM protein NirJ [Gammaproteobacteria bacterium]
MFRISKFMQQLLHPTPLPPPRQPPAPVVIWNLIRRCNQTCKHCYAISADTDFANELSFTEVCRILDELKALRVPALILSGGEPLLRDDILAIAARAKALGIYTALSSNGTLINEDNIAAIAAIGFDYLGISIDGIGKTHDQFRRMAGAYDASMHAIRLCRDHGIKVGLRYTMTQDNFAELPQLLDLLDSEGIDKFYFSHLNYAGRGNKNRKDDVFFNTTREAMDLLFSRALTDLQAGKKSEFVTGNNDADGVYLLHWVKRHYPQQADHIHRYLQRWGGNSSGVNIANIDNLGHLHPDTMWWNYDLGSLRERRFADIWQDRRDPLMNGLKMQPRPVEGRCKSCIHLDICNGNTRVRAMQLTGNPWAEDPGCYLTDTEIGLHAT